MKIDPGLKPIRLPPSIETRSAGSPSTNGAAAEQTQVNLSTRVSQLNQMETQLATVDVVDRSRVDRIKAALAAGEYTINSENIADTLLASAKEILHVSK